MPHIFHLRGKMLNQLMVCCFLLTVACKSSPSENIEWRRGKDLRSAAGFGTRQEVIDLLAQGADVNAKDNLGQTPLTLALTMYAAYRMANIKNAPGGGIDERKAVIKLLIERGANPNVVAERAMTPLMNAAASGDIEIVELLLRAGAADTLKQMDVDGLTARDYAVSQGHDDIANELALTEKR